jgi:hypothetical protein
MTSQNEKIETLQKRLKDVEDELKKISDELEESKFLAEFGVYSGRMIEVIAYSYDTKELDWEAARKGMRIEKRAVEMKNESFDSLKEKPFHKELCSVLDSLSCSLHDYYSWVQFSGDRNNAFHSGLGIIGDHKNDEKLKLINKSLQALNEDVPQKYLPYYKEALSYEL